MYIFKCTIHRTKLYFILKCAMWISNCSFRLKHSHRASIKMENEYERDEDNFNIFWVQKLQRSFGFKVSSLVTSLKVTSISHKISFHDLNKLVKWLHLCIYACSPFNVHAKPFDRPILYDNCYVHFLTCSHIGRSFHDYSPVAQPLQQGQDISKHSCKHFEMIITSDDRLNGIKKWTRNDFHSFAEILFDSNAWTIPR